MAATYTFNVFSSLDGFGSHNGYWGKQDPHTQELIYRPILHV